MDRFGLFNFQLYHKRIDLYLSDLTVNGHKVDLSKDPAWEGRGNRVQFAEQDFQRQDYGYSETNWAGEEIGEVGGQFSSVEPIDPGTGYYVDDIGELTLDDPVSFSGKVCFVNDSTDAGMQIGYFNSKDLVVEMDSHSQMRTPYNSMGILVEGPARAGKFFMPHIHSNMERYSDKDGLSFNPVRVALPFKVEYDPTANNNIGRITATLAEESVTLDLTKEQREAGATFDRFGVANLRLGGKFVEVYYDDLTYTARRSKDYKPVYHQQEATKVPYPEGGRKY
jgi:hypothetical protein